MEELPPRPDFLPPGFGTVGHQGFVEIVAPLAVPFTPQTAGWVALFVLLFLAAAWSATRALRRYRANAYRRAALSELASLRSAASGSERDRAMAELPGLLKRCALLAFTREQVAGLSGERWLVFLEHTAPGALDQAAKQTLATLVVNDADQVPRTQDQALLQGAERWLREHRV